jgi:hypothetical protein
MTRLAKFARLPWSRKTLLLRCWFGLNAIALALRLLPLPTVLKLMGTNSGTLGVPGETTKEEIVWTVGAAAALSWKSTCAVRALVAERTFRRHGFPVRFKCGVSTERDFQAHAWIEDETGVLVGESEREYHSLPDLTSPDVVARS